MEYQVVPFYAVSTGEVDDWDVCVLLEDCISHSWALGSGDGRFLLQLNYNLLLHGREHPGEELELGVPVLPYDHGKTSARCIGDCYYCLRVRSKYHERFSAGNVVLSGWVIVYWR